MEHNDMQFDVDALLRDTAQADNEALPFSDWKAALLQKAAEDAPTQGNTLTFDPQKKKRALPSRQWVIGLSTVAAAFLLVVGLNALRAPVAEAPMLAAPAAAPFAMNAAEPESAPMLEADAFASGAAGQDTSRMAETAPMLPEGAPDSAAAQSTTGAMDALPSSGGGAADSAAAPYMGAMPTPVDQEEALAAIHAVQAALGLPQEADEQALVLLTQNTGYTLARLDAPGSTFQLQSTLVYEVTLSQGTAPGGTYVVDAKTLEVLGRVAG